MVDHIFGVVLKLLEEPCLIEHETKILKMLIKGMRDRSIDIDALHDLLVGLFNLLIKRADHIVQFLLVVLLFALTKEELI